MKHKIMKTAANTQVFQQISNRYVSSFNPNERIIITNEKNMKKFLSSVLTNPNRVAVVADYDYTLTKKYSYHRELTYRSSFAMLKRCEKVSDEFILRTKQLFNKYSPIESNASIDETFQIRKVEKWFNKDMELILREKLSKDDFREVFQDAVGEFFFRHGILEFFQLLEKNNISLFVLSAGLYQIINESFKLILPHYQELKDKHIVNIIANKFIYDKDSINQKDMIINSYNTPVIHTFNKAERLRQESINFLDEDANIIVLGDHFNDSKMISKIKPNNCLKIGFFNENIENLDDAEKQIERYKKSYDALILNDGNFTFINSLIKKISQRKFLL